MAAPPNLPPIAPSDFYFPTNALADSNVPFPNFAPRPTMPPPTMNSQTQTVVPPPAQPPNAAESQPGGSRSSSHSRDGSREGRSRSRSRSESGDGSRNRSRSNTSNSEDDGDSEEDAGPEQVEWRTIEEDESTPCEDELKFIESRPELNISALDDRYWSDKTFSMQEDVSILENGRGTIEWTIDFNGTKEKPNKEHVMRSPVVNIAGYDWQIAFYPRGCRSENYLSVQLECKTMLSDDYQEFEEFDPPPFPFLEGADTSNLNKKRRSIAVQLSVIMYNPVEPRTHMERIDAHRFTKKHPDYGWPYFTHRENFHHRQHGQRRAILQDDKLAFKTYVRVLHDPTRNMWANSTEDPYQDSLLSTSLRPFCGQSPYMAALIPLLHFSPFREMIKAQHKLTKTAYSLQSLLWKMYSRTRSDRYGRRDRTYVETADAVSCLQEVREALIKEIGQPASALLGTLDSEQGSPVGRNRLPIKHCKTLQAGLEQLSATIETPPVLFVELQRQEFDVQKRRWNKLTNRVEVSEHYTIGGVEYSLFAAVAHCGDLTSNKHNVYVQPYSSAKLWYGYQEGRVVPMTFKQAIRDHEGKDPSQKKSNPRRNPYLDPVHDETEVIYLVMLVRADYIQHLENPPKDYRETWDVPSEIRQGLPLPKIKAAGVREQDLADEEKAALDAPDGAATPIWLPTDDEGDTVMSDAGDDPATVSANIDVLGRDRYTGEMLGGLYHGHGTLISTSGDQYSGSFHLGKPSGRGKMVYAATGNIYEGEFAAGVHHGKGKLTESSTGNVWEGGWKEGKKHGEFVHRGTVTEDDRGMCSICMERELTTAFWDCGHLIACKGCAERVDMCPVCRRRVVGRLQIWGVKMVLE